MVTDLLTIHSSWIPFLVFFKCAVKKGKFQKYILKYACLCVKNLRHKQLQIHCYNSESTQLHFRRSKLGYKNDLLLCLDYMKITRLHAWICKVTSSDFCSLLPSIQSGHDIFFNTWISTKRKRLSHLLFFVLSWYTRSDFQIGSRLYVPKWLWNKS